MSTTSMAIFSNPLFATYSVYARNASIDTFIHYWQARLKTCMCAEGRHFETW